MSLSVVVLAAGQGVRMHSKTPKVLHSIGGLPILARILTTVKSLNPKQIIVVYGHQGEQLKEAFLGDPLINWVEQGQTLGTGHATLQALPKIADVNHVLILYGDIPLIQEKTLERLLTETPQNCVGLITAFVEDPTGFGRIIRDQQGALSKIVEEKDATLDEKKITEINTGFFLIPKTYLQKWLPKLSNQNTQKEYLLTDIITLAKAEGIDIKTLSPEFEWEVRGINDKYQLAQLERVFQLHQANQLLKHGVTLLDPARFDLRGEIQTGQDVLIDVNVILEGKILLGNNVQIGPNVYLKNVVVEENTKILANSIVEDARIGSECTIGPFARIRPGTLLDSHAKIGNFVEIKNTTVGPNSKINHLSYVGDATVGSNVNIGAGTITCNYDGKKKHATFIEDNVSIGSDSQLIAPVTIGKGATIGAGTTVTRDVPENYLIHNELQHRKIANWIKEEEK